MHVQSLLKMHALKLRKHAIEYWRLKKKNFPINCAGISN
jgi:hypothetical protein